MSLDYLPLSYRRTHSIQRVREARSSTVPPLRQPEANETPLSPAEVVHGMRVGLVRPLTKSGGDL